MRIDPRKEKRAFRKMGMSDEVERAWLLGNAAATAKHPRNPYPPGRRHDEWERGFRTADPLGDWHGRNE